MPIVIALTPNTAPNDLDTPVVISGTGYSAVLSGTQVISSPMAYLGETRLDDLVWVSSTTLSATLPWGLEPGVYTLTVQNPSGETGNLPNAFTVTQGIGVWTTNGPFGGNVGQITLHPMKPDTIFAQGWDVGLFISDDAAERWEMAFRLPRWHVDISFDTQDGQLFYVGDEHGLSRTRDGTLSWDDISIRTGGWWEHVPAAHPTLPNVVYTAVGSWRYPEQKGGVFRSDNYGENWITLTVNMTDTHFTSLAIHPVFTQTLLAGTESGNIFYSQDGGQNWSWATNITDTVASLYFNPYEPLQAWATTDGENNAVQSLYRSTNLAAWTPIAVDAGLTGGSSFGWDVDFTPGKVWVTTNGSTFSTDGSDVWTKLDVEGSCGPGSWLAINPVNTQVMYGAPNTQGVCKSEDGGATWQQANNGLAAIVPARTTVNPNDPDTVYVRAAGLDLAKSDNGGQAWRVLDIGLGASPSIGLAVDPFIPGRLYVNNMLSTDGGDTFVPLTFTLPVTWTGWTNNGVTYLAPHPTETGRILAGLSVSDGDSDNGLLFASDNHGNHWNFIGPAQSISTIVQIAYDTEDSGLIYVAASASGLWKSADGGQTWQKSTLPAGFTETWHVFTHPDHPGTVYSFVRQPPHGEFKFLVSGDAGETWTVLPDGPGGPFYFAATQPPSLYSQCFFNGLMYLCRSWDGGYNWELIDEMQQEITTLSGGIDGERVIIYVGTKGGQVSSTPGTLSLNATHLDSLPGRGSLTGAGVYRMTTLVSPLRLFLPMIIR